MTRRLSTVTVANVPDATPVKRIGYHDMVLGQVGLSLRLNPAEPILVRSGAGCYVHRVPHASHVLFDQILQRDNTCGVSVSPDNSGEVAARAAQQCQRLAVLGGRRNLR
jgi:hypothetical protein